MMGRSHAASGWVAGLALAGIVGLTGVAEVAPFAATVAGFALLPDLDHPGSRASRLLGPVTGALSRFLRWCSARLYAVTKGPKDERCEGKHRHMTHTLVFAVLLGGLTAWVTAAWGVPAVLVVLALGMLLAVDALGDWLLAVPVITGIAVAGSQNPAAALDAALQPAAGWLGIAVAAGCLVHCLGDSITLSGCPWLFPLLIRGETWYELRPPRWLRFRTGGAVENFVVFPVLTVLGVLLVPGVWNRVTELFTAS